MMKGMLQVSSKKTQGKKWFVKLDPKKRKLLLFKDDKSRVASSTIDLSLLNEVKAMGALSFEITTGKGTSKFEAVSEKEASSWVEQLNKLCQEDNQRSPSLKSRFSTGRRARKTPSGGSGNYSSRLSTTREKVRRSDFPGLPARKEREKSDAYRIILQSVEEFEQSSDSKHVIECLLRVAKKLVEHEPCFPFLGARFAHSAYSLAARKGNRGKSKAAAALMMRAEEYVLTGTCPAGDAKSSDRWDRKYNVLLRFLAEGRKDLQECLVEKDVDFVQRVSEFSEGLYNMVLKVLCASIIKQLPKPPLKFSVVVFGYDYHTKERLPYDSVTVGVVCAEIVTEKEHFEYFEKFLRLMEIALCNLGEAATPVLSAGWGGKLTGGMFLNNSEVFPKHRLIGSVEQYIKFMDYANEDERIKQTFSLWRPFLIGGDKAPHKKYVRDVNAFFALHVNVITAEKQAAGIASYYEISAKKDSVMTVGMYKAMALCAKVAFGWLGDLLMDHERHLPMVKNLRREFWFPLRSMLLAIHMARFPAMNFKEDTLIAHFSNSQDDRLIERRSAKYLMRALKNLRKARLTGQLKSRSGNENLYNPAFPKRPQGTMMLSPKHLPKVLALYQTVIPVIVGMEDYAFTRLLTRKTFNHSFLRMESDWVKLVGLERLGMEGALLAAMEEKKEESMSVAQFKRAQETCNDILSKNGRTEEALIESAFLRGFTAGTKSRKAVVNTTAKMAIIFQRSGDLESCEKYNLAALDAVKDGMCRRDVAAIDINRGANLFLQGDNEGALEELRKGLEAFERYNATAKVPSKELRENTPLVLFNIALVHFRKGDMEEARRVFLDGLDKMRPYSDPEQTVFLLNLAMCARELGNDEEKFTFLFQALSEMARVYGSSFKRYIAAKVAFGF